MMSKAFRLAAVLVLALAGAPLARAAESYRIDQTFGDIVFSVRHLGLFSSRGSFDRFTGELTIDQAHPEHTQVDVTIDTGSVVMGWSEARAMLRSPAYFDVQHYPWARFASTEVAAAGPAQYRVAGRLTIRGITRPILLQAALVGRHPAPDGRGEIAEFVVTGELRRSEFGMVADRAFISDRVKLEIHARLRLEEEEGGGGPG
jgi:polyisoprenoid-binding protein YceI